MKADKWGTPSEQARWRCNWKSPSERRGGIRQNVMSPQDRCAECRHLLPADTQGRVTGDCHLMKTATADNAWCPDFARAGVTP